MKSTKHSRQHFTASHNGVNQSINQSIYFVTHKKHTVHITIIAKTFILCVTGSTQAGTSPTNHCWLAENFKDCLFMWYKNIAGRFFGLVTKHAACTADNTIQYNAFSCSQKLTSSQLILPHGTKQESNEKTKNN